MYLTVAYCEMTVKERADYYCCGKCIVFMRRDLHELEAIAQKFEQEDGIKEAIQKQNLLCETKEDGYSPYSEINFSQTPETDAKIGFCSQSLNCISQKEHIVHGSLAFQTFSDSSTLSSSILLDDGSSVENDVSTEFELQY